MIAQQKAAPGVMLMSSMPLSSTAVEGVNGRPSESSGIMPPPAAALLAASGPATPSIAPCPSLVPVARHLPLDAVGHEGGDGRAPARDQPD